MADTERDEKFLRGGEQPLPFLDRKEWTVEQALEWALQRVRVSLDCGTYYDKAMSALQEAQIAAEKQRAPASETGRITELESKLAAMESALKGASNYIADSETHPQRIEFADGRVVAMKGQGYLYVSRKEAE